MRILCSLIFLLMTVSVAAETVTVYQSEDAQGDVSFSDTPISPSEKTITVDIPAAASASSNVSPSVAAPSEKMSYDEYTRQRRSLVENIRVLELQLKDAQNTKRLAESAWQDQSTSLEQTQTMNPDSSNQLSMLQQNLNQARERVESVQNQLDNANTQLQELDETEGVR